MAQVIIHQRHARGVGGNVAAGKTHGHAHLGAGKNWTVVNSIAHHQCAVPAANEIFQFLVLLFRQAFSLNGIHTNRFANTRRHFQAVARKDADFAHAQFAQSRNNLAGILSQLVLKTNGAQVAAAQHHMHAAHALNFFGCFINLRRDGRVILQ